MTRAIGYPVALLIGFFMGMGGWSVLLVEAVATGRLP